MNKSVVVIGAGPAGIGAALKLKEECTVLERASSLGGLAATVIIDGAVFDFGGHSFHTPHQEVRDLVFNSLDMYEQRRDARCFAFGEFIPYPFQKNFKSLSNAQVVMECARGLETATNGQAPHFEAFIEQRFGAGISRHFMLPYNRKLWGRDLKRLAADWTGERVAAPDGVQERFETKGGKRKPLQADTLVAYPAKGGYGEIYHALARQIPDLRLNESVVRIDPRRKIAVTKSGNSYQWRYLISTLPIPILLDLIEGSPEVLRRKAAQLDCLSLKLGLVVIDHPVDTEIQRVYSAEEQIPAHKTAINHNSSDYLRSLPHHGIMAEISIGPDKSLLREDIEQWIVDSLLEMDLIHNAGEVRHVEVRDIPFAYPVPTADRDAIVGAIHQWLEDAGIYSVGRFGQWAYINSDEAIHRGMLLGEKLLAL